MTRRKVLIGLPGPKLDGGQGPPRWEKWRPTIALFLHPELLFDRYAMVYQARHGKLAEVIAEDIGHVSPETEVTHHHIEYDDPWEFEGVYQALWDFARSYPFDPDEEDYYIHITTGTHVAQICMFLLTEAHYLPGRLIQSAPPTRNNRDEPGEYRVIDLDLSRYDQIASRHDQEQQEAQYFLKRGIETRSPRFNRLIEQIEQVAIASRAPILLTGPTGAGKTLLARRIFELKKTRRQVSGEFVEVNCATLRGDGAMSTLFGHKRGAFTGAINDRPGLLRAADQGLLFLDEIGELGLDEQAMLLRAIESGVFLPVGADKETQSHFQLLAGTNRDLWLDVNKGKFREDLLARINLWTFELPGLKDRLEDIEPNLQYELDQWARKQDTHVTFNREGRERFLAFATHPNARWAGNFRDLNAAITRMATLAPGGRITLDVVREEIERLERGWRQPEARSEADDALERLLGKEAAEELDRFDRVQLADVLTVCRKAATLSEAGRVLFAVSRAKKASSNDADRLRKYLTRFNLSWADVQDSRQ